MMNKIPLLGSAIDDLQKRLAALDSRGYRARQVHDHLYRRRNYDFRLMTDLPRSLRTVLEDHFVAQPLSRMEVFHSLDGTRRYLLGGSGDDRLEAVWIPDERRDTICISTQAGCPLACAFCMTGVIGLSRNLAAGEIVAEVGLVLNHVYGAGQEPRRGVNLVLMGMGEPLANYEEVMRAVRLFAEPNGMNISQRRITLSTAGVVPKIYELASEPIRPELAVSLAATRDDLRNELMPINKQWPIAELLKACRDYPLRPHEQITFEYVMLDGVNDSRTDAAQLADLIRGMEAKVNLIPHNPAPELPYRASPDYRILEFQSILRGHGILAFVRTPRGRDISAACGQLAARTSSSPPRPQASV
ncbi:MAG: 23S rRNA (adenine(2503)-C(2))-methyltransferase RlmN [Acidobacteria bacterium]|nr:23S rRNA (adenine(2503)-C(2))-methyltransferase RlmN [Acidobacteriota bacterium]